MAEALSDEELERLIAEKQSGVEGLSDEELQRQIARRQQFTSEEAGTLGVGSAVNTVGENIQRAGQFLGEQAGVLSERDRAQLEQRLAQDDEFRDRMRREVPGFSRGELIGGMGIGSLIRVPGVTGAGRAVRGVTGALEGGISGALGSDEGEQGSGALVGAGLGGALSQVAPRRPVVASESVDAAVDTFRQARIADLADVSEDVFEGVLRPQTVLDDAVQNAYKVARETAPGARNIELRKLAGLVQRSRGQERLSGGIPSAVRTELVERGIIDEAGNFRESVDVATAEELRIAMNSFFESTNGAGRKLIREFKDALDDEVISKVGEDIFEEARSLKRAFETNLSRARISRFDKKGGKSIVRKILENDIAPEEIVPRVLQKGVKAQDLDQLVTFLRESGEGEALGSLKQGVLKHFFIKGAETGSDRIWNNRAFSRALRAFGGSKLRVLFERDELGQLSRLGRLEVADDPGAVEAVVRSIQELPVIRSFLAASDQADRRAFSQLPIFRASVGGAAGSLANETQDVIEEL